MDKFHYKDKPEIEKISNIDCFTYREKGSHKYVVMVPAWFGSMFSQAEIIKVVTSTFLKEKNKYNLNIIIPKFGKEYNKNSLNATEYIWAISDELELILKEIKEVDHLAEFVLTSHSWGGVSLAYFLSKNNLEEFNIKNILMICPTFSYSNQNKAKKFINMSHNNDILKKNKEKFLENFKSIFEKIKGNCNYGNIDIIVPDSDWQCTEEDANFFVTNSKLILIKDSNHIFNIVRKKAIYLNKKN